MWSQLSWPSALTRAALGEGRIHILQLAFLYVALLHFDDF